MYDIRIQDLFLWGGTGVTGEGMWERGSLDAGEEAALDLGSDDTGMFTL